MFPVIIKKDYALRHTFATRALEIGIPTNISIAEVQKAIPKTNKIRPVNEIPSPKNKDFMQIANESLFNDKINFRETKVNP